MLSKISPIPRCAWNHVYPCKLVHDIKQQLRSSPTWEGLLADNQDCSNSNKSTSSSDPAAFSFWMASNLPLKRSEQVELLECHCLAKRLLFVLNYIRRGNSNEQANRRIIQCASCDQTISEMKYVFGVPGAEGTTGAYVNEHGYLHQTMTVRELYDGGAQQQQPHDDSRQRDVCLAVGSPQTKDSWFPGYSWTMVHCATCFGHVGWKFLPATPDTRDSKLHYFWGLTSSSVTVAEASESRFGGNGDGADEHSFLNHGNVDDEEFDQDAANREILVRHMAHIVARTVHRQYYDAFLQDDNDDDDDDEFNDEDDDEVE